LLGTASVDRGEDRLCRAGARLLAAETHPGQRLPAIGGLNAARFGVV
jgi:hypothetical protein